MFLVSALDRKSSLSKPWDSVRFGSLSDIVGSNFDVRFVPKAGIGNLIVKMVLQSD